MVVGIVIGSGVFFKADDVLKASGGSVSIALIAWVIGAISMLFGTLFFADCSTRFEVANGIVDYSEKLVGKRYAHLVGWFKTLLYYPALAAVLAWVSANYTTILFGVGSKEVFNRLLVDSENLQFSTGDLFLWSVAIFYILAVFAMNYLAPLISGKFQVSATVIKLIPLLLIGLFGLIGGVSNGVLIENFTVSTAQTFSFGSFSSAVLATAFAYEGWIIATTINSEIHDSKRNLSIALTLGGLLVVVIYILYFLGIASQIPVGSILEQGDSAVTGAATQLFGPFAGALLTVAVVISCLGTLNGLMLGVTRSFYSLAVRDQGPAPEFFKKVSPKANIPFRSAEAGLILIFVYLFVWFANFKGLWPNDRFVDISELPIALIYGLYIALYISYMVQMKEVAPVKRFVIPILALLGASIVVLGALSKESRWIDLSISLVIFLSGLLVYRKKK